MHFTVLVALAVVASSVLGSTVVDAVSTVPAPWATFHSRVIPKDFTPTGFRRNGEGSMDQVLEYVATQRDNNPTIHPDIQVQVARSLGDVITGPAVAHDNDSNSQDGAPMNITHYAKRDGCPACGVLGALS
ncbi:hypothetical protein P692DRAFT_20871175, partial [Suillus brevipes Sb2]